MADKLWFGHARGHMQNVPCPLIGSSVTRNRYLERIQFENGGGDGRRSNQYQMQYDFQFSGLAHEVDGIDAFNKFAQGFYGDDLIYLAHPAAFETNLFPAGWATPSLSEKGWGKISTDAVAYSNADGPMYTNLVTNPSMEGVASGTDSTKRTNLVTNPSFETDTTGWVASNATLSRNTTEKYIGTASLSMVATAQYHGGYSDSSVTASQTYTWSAWVKGEAGKLINIEFNERTASASVGISYGSATMSGGWQRISITRTFGSTGIVARITVMNGTVGAHTFYVDAVMLEAASEARSYFDGTYAEDPTLIEAWTGTVNNSTSTALVRGVSNRENLVTNPSFEVDAGGWSAISSTTISRVTTHSHVGIASLQSVATATSAATGLNDITVAGSSTYTFSAWVKGEAGKTIFLALRELTSAGAEIGRTNTSEFVMTGDWQRVSVTRSFGSTGVKASAYLRNGTVAAAHTYYVDAVMLEQSTTVNPYFDGSYTDAPGWTTSWAGTANDSRSVATAAPVTVRTNLVTNPSMETVTSGTVVMRRNLMYNASMISSTGVLPDNMNTYTTGGSTGTRSTVSGSSATSISAVSLPATGNRFGHSYPVAAGTLSGLSQTMTVSAVVSGLTGTNISAKFYVDFVDATGNVGSAVATTTANGTISATNSSLTRVPTGYTAYVFLESTSGAVTGAAATFSNLLIENGAVVGTFFSGATTDALGWDYAWSGTANASISTAACAATTVRTNLVPNPSLETNILNIASSAGTGGTNALTRETSGGWTGTSFARATWSVGTTAISGNMENVTSATTTVGATYTGSAYVRVNSAQRLVLQATGTSVGTTTATAVDVPANTWTRLSYTHANVTTAGTLNIRVGVSGGRNWVAGDTLDVDGWLLEASSTLGDYFDGSFSPAGDFSYAWTNTANASPSVQYAPAVASMTAINCAPAASRSWALTGNQSLRVIPTSTSNNDTFVSLGGDIGAFRLGMSAGNTYTVSGTIRLAAMQTGTINSRARCIAFFYKDSAGSYVETRSTVAPNTAGSTRLSVTVSIPAGATEAFIRLNNGALAGNGDVWWDNVLLEASPIVQDYFDGSVVSADADLTNSWSGTAHASTSLMRGVGVASSTQGGGTASIQSTGWSSTGTKSIRIIPTTTANNSWVRFDIPTTVGESYTVMGKLRQTQALAGSQWPNARRINAYNSALSTVVGQSAQAANAAGVYSHSVTFVAASTTTPILLGNGASAGNGDVWWDDLMVVAGTYTGAYFDGDSTDPGNTTYNWTGAANASTSTMLSEMVLYGNPPRATTYTVTNINQPPTKVCTLVIPPEYTLYLGASGTSTGSAGVFIRPIQASDSLYYGPTEELTLLDPNGSVRMNKTLNGATYQAVEIFLMKTDANVGTVTLNSMMAQLYKTGTTPQLPSEHYQGEGSTGLMFADDAIVETYSYMHPPRKGIATTLIEVEAWR